METFSFKKQYKDLYPTKSNVTMVDVPALTYIAVEGKGNPNEEEGEYKKALQSLYAIAWTIKMSKMKVENPIESYHEYVMPPLDGFWWSEESVFDPRRKELFKWVSTIVQPNFVNDKVLAWAKQEVMDKKGIDASAVYLYHYEEKRCVQCLHIGSYDDESITTIPKMHAYARDCGYEIDVNKERRHHEIYLNDPRKVQANKLKTIIRLPIKETNYDVVK